jgi:hypothetical protein
MRIAPANSRRSAQDHPLLSAAIEPAPQAIRENDPIA